MIVLKFLVALLLPSILLAEQIDSRQNYIYSVYKPSKKVFIEKAKGNYLYNHRLKEIYSDPLGSSTNSLIWAVSMDYVYGDGSDSVKNAYANAAFSIRGSSGYLASLQYFDFLIRTSRYNDVLKLNTKICGRDAPQCSYYKIVAKHLLGQSVLKEECAEAIKFFQMRRMTISICD